MEEGQRLSLHLDWQTVSVGLNPCCNGRGSKTPFQALSRMLTAICLNPCCNGRGSKTEEGNGGAPVLASLS